MTFEEAIRKSIKAYHKGIEPKEYFKSTKTPKYNKKYLDSLEKEFFGEEKKDSI